MILRILLILVLSGCILSWAYWLLAWRCLVSVLRRRPAADASFEPTVSLLKPVKGVDSGALENFASFCSQNYPRYELLFGVSDEDDPAVPVVAQLKQRFPGQRIQLLVADPLGSNPKAAILHRLSSEACGEVLVISDSDIRVTEDYVRRVVAPLSDPRVGLVTCLYRGEAARNFTARVAALHMDASFAPSASLGWKLGIDVGLGATMVMRAADLRRVGGYRAFADSLLDDYEAAGRLAGLGLKVWLSDYVVASVLGSQQFGEQWHREVRWSRGIRTAHPLQYCGVIVTFSTPLGVLAAALSGVWPWAWVAASISLLVRWFVGWRCANLLGQRDKRYLALLPIRDVMSAVVWLAAFVGRRVSWRGREFELRSDGRLVALSTGGLPDGWLSAAVRRIDLHLRRRDGIFEFVDDDRCVFRVAAVGARDELTFADGTRVGVGEPVGELHLWNEHLPRIPRGGADMGWAGATRRATIQSLFQLAHAAEHDPRMAGAKAFGATATFFSRRGNAAVARMAERFGFEWIITRRRPSLGRRLHDLGENVLLLGLQWTFNPRGLKGKPFFRPREQLWMSRQTLLDRYGSGAPVATSPAPVTT